MRAARISATDIIQSDEISQSGHVYLFAWLQSRWSSEAAKHIMVRSCQLAMAMQAREHLHSPWPCRLPVKKITALSMLSERYC